MKPLVKNIFRSPLGLFPLPLFVAGIMLWGSHRMVLQVMESGRAPLRYHSELAVQGLADDLKQSMEAEIAPLQRFAERWKTAKGFSLERWRSDSIRFFTPYTNILATARLNADGSIVWAVPIQGDRPLKDLKAMLRLPQISSRFNLNSDIPDPQITPVVNLHLGQSFVVALIPLASGSRYNGYMATLIRLDDLFKNIFKTQLIPNYNICLKDGNEVVYERQIETNVAQTFAVRQVIQLYGRAWKLKLTPGNVLAANLYVLWPRITFGVGVLLAVLFGLVVFFAEVNWVRSRTAERAKGALKASEERLRLTLDTAHDAFISVDHMGVVTEWNRQAQNIFGWASEEVLGKAFENLIFTNGLPKILAIDGQELAENLQLQTEAKTKSGKIIFVEIAVWSMNQGRRSSLNFFIKDISKRVEAEKAIRESETKYRNLMEAVPDIILTWSPDGVITSLNTAFETITGFSRAVWLNRPLISMIHTDDQAQMSTMLRQLILTGKSIRTEARVLNSENEYLTLETVAMPQLREGRVVSIMGVARDMSQRKRAEEIERQTKLQLEVRVSQRTAELHRQAQELSRSNAELEQFAYIASHDLKEPLRAVTSYLQLLERRYAGKLDERGQEYMKFVLEGAARMAALIDSLLSYSRVGRTEINFSTIDTALIFKNSLANLDAAIREAQAVVTSDPLPSISADEKQVGQLIQNLIANAIKFRRQDPPRVHVGVAERDGEWIFSVSDNGIGIEEQYYNRVFTLFKRLHARNVYPGTGIGLAVCKKIIERHGGRIWVDSKINIGTTMYFSIPVIPPTHHERRDNANDSLSIAA